MIPPSTRWVSQRIDGGSRRSIKRVPQQCGKRRCLWITNRQKKIRTLWHCDSQHHLACHILCEKNHAIFWGEFNEMFHYKPAFLLGSERGIPISLEEILPIIHPRNPYNFAATQKNSANGWRSGPTSEELGCEHLNLTACSQRQTWPKLCKIIHRKIPKFGAPFHFLVSFSEKKCGNAMFKKIKIHKK